METRLMYPEFILYVAIIMLALLFVWKKKYKYKKGIVVANSKYVRETAYYKALEKKYKIYSIFIVIICIVAIVIGTVITARLYKEDAHEETNETKSRDIIFSLYMGGSNQIPYYHVIYNNASGNKNGVTFDQNRFDSTLNEKRRNWPYSELYKKMDAVLDSCIEFVKKLDGDRFGMVLTITAPSTILPLTDDYNYAISILKKLKESLRECDFEWTGAFSSSPYNNPDGLGASILNFEQANRTNIIVNFNWDYYDSGLCHTTYIGYNQLTDYLTKNNVTLYVVDLMDYDLGNEEYRVLENVNDNTCAFGIAKKAFKANKLPVNALTKEISTLEKTLLIEKDVDTVKVDLPNLLFPYLLLLVVALFVLDWRLRV